MRPRYLLPVLILTMLLFTSCTEESTAPLPPAAQPPAYTSCTITLQGIIFEQQYSTRRTIWGIDSIITGSFLDTLRSTTSQLDSLTADGFLFNGRASKGGFVAGMPWDSSRAIRAEFDAQSGYLLALQFSRDNSSSSRSPGGLSASNESALLVRGEGYAAQIDTTGEFVWEGQEAVEAFFHTVTLSENYSGPSSFTTEWTTGLRFLPDCRIVIRFR